MRIAICLFGQQRDFDESSNSIIDFFDFEEVDYFVHTWNGISYPHEKEIATIEALDLDLVKKKVLTTYKPKKVCVDEYSILDRYLPDFMYKYTTPYGKKVKFDWEVYNIVGMYYSIEKVQSMRCDYELENSFEYDLVINMRLDSYMRKEYLNLKSYFNRVKKDIMEEKGRGNNQLYVASLNLNGGMVCIEDHWFISDSEGMRIFTNNLVDNLIFISKENLINNPIHNEIVLGKNATNKKMTVNQLDFPTSLVRDSEL